MKGQRHQAGGDQRDGETVPALGIVSEHQTLTDAGEQHDGQQEAQSRR